VPRLYAIADRDALAGQSLVAAVRAMADAGVHWIQVRAKRAAGAVLHAELAACCEALAGGDVRLWVDDRVDLAALLPVGGVHLGQQDLPAAAARRLLAPGVLIGFSTHDLAQLAIAAADPAVDVVAVGPIFPTRSKERPDPVVGLELVREARRLTEKPVVAIGGIDAGNAGEVLAAGADAVVVLGAICGGDVAARARALVEAVS